MKAMKATKSSSGKMTKGGIAGAIAEKHDLKKVACSRILDSLAEIGASEVKSNGKFVLPGLCMIKTKRKAATKAGKKMMFGQKVLVKAKPAKTVVKAFAVAALKKEFK